METVGEGGKLLDEDDLCPRLSRVMAIYIDGNHGDNWFADKYQNRQYFLTCCCKISDIFMLFLFQASTFSPDMSVKVFSPSELHLIHKKLQS